MTVVDEIVDSLNNSPEDWYWDGFNLIHKKFAIEIWVGSTGITFLEVKQRFGVKKLTLGWWDKRKLWKAVDPLVRSIKNSLKINTMADFGVEQ